MKSNMKSESLRREREHGVEVLSYGSFGVLETVLKRFDEIIVSGKKGVQQQKEVYIKHMILNEAFFKHLDIFLQRNNTIFKDFVSHQISLLKIENIVYAITVHASRMYLFLLVKFSLSKLGESGDMISSETKNFKEDFGNLCTQIPEDYDKLKGYEITYRFLLDKYLKEDFGSYGNTEILSEIFWTYLQIIYENDLQEGVIGEQQFSDIAEFYDGLDIFLPGNSGGSIFLKSLGSYGMSFQILFGMVGSTAENLSQQEEFRNLSGEDRKKIFFSIKRDLLVEAKFWSKQFLNDNQNLTESMSMVTFMPDTSTIPKDKFLYDFENLQISLDGTTFLVDPIKPDLTTIRRGCPVAFTTGEGMGGSFLARQIDIALELYWENYLSKI